MCCELLSRILWLEPSFGRFALPDKSGALTAYQRFTHMTESMQEHTTY